MLKIHFTGTAAGLVEADANNTSTVLETDGGLILIDAGDGVYSSMMRQGLKLARLTHVFITHNHADHILGLPAVLWAVSQDLEVYFPEAEGEPMGELYRKLCPHHHYHGFCPGDVVDCHGVVLRAIFNCHIDPYIPREKEGKMFSLSFDIRYQGQRILYSGDLSTQAGEHRFWRELEGGVDVLILEASHIQPKELMVQRLQAASIRYLLFNHIWRDMVVNYDVADYLKVHLDFPVHFTSDGDCFDVDSGRLFRRSELQTSLKAPRKLSSEEKIARFKAEGTPYQWRILGPFPNPKQDGEYVGLKLNPQNVLADAMGECTGSYVGLHGQRLSWRTCNQDMMTSTGLLPYSWIYSGEEMVNYGVTDITVEEGGSYVVLWGSDDGCRILLDGEEIAYDPFKRGAVKDQNKREVFLEKGRHRIIEVQDTRRGGWGIYLRIIKKAQNLPKEAKTAEDFV